MTLRVAINGFGRIGRLVLRALYEQNNPDIQVVAINDLSEVESNAHLFKYDSIHGRFPGEIKVSGTTMDIGLGPIQVLAHADPANLPWKEMAIDMVFECSGRFTSKEKASVHLHQGAKRVLISAPADGVDRTIVYGVNHDQLTASDLVVSNASCTTNCLAPVAMVLQQAIGIERGYMTTIHAYTGDQRLVDSMHKDLQRARAATLSMIPSSTGAARALGLVLPELKGKLDGTAIRVPVANVSLIDFTFTSAQPTTADAINAAMVKAAEGSLKGVLAVTHEQLVSCDFNHCPASSTFDLNQTQVIDGHFCRVLAWYDNEWGFSNRMLDTARSMARFL
ncbi:MAG: type I glyceraldehyde-3-phosphate dehydrogenase [Holosporales bacterium]